MFCLLSYICKILSLPFSFAGIYDEKGAGGHGVDLQQDDEHTIIELEKEVRSLEQAINMLYIETAKSILQQAKRTCKKADSLTDALIDKKCRLVRLRGDQRCPSCLMINAKNSRFCTFCGNRLTDD